MCKYAGHNAPSSPAAPDSLSTEDHFRLMMEGIPDSSIFLLDEQGVVKTWNSGAERLHGYAERDIVGRSITVFYPPEDLAPGQPEQRLRIAAATGIFEDEGWRVRNDGARFWAKTVITPLRSDLGQPIGFSVVVRDLTERRSAEEALRLSEARFEGIVRISEDAIISIDNDQTITMFNDGAEKIFGYTAVEVIGKRIESLVPDRFGAMHHRHVQNFGSSPDSLRAMNERGAIFGKRKDGSEFPAEASISKFEVGGEKVLTVRLRDITARMRAEEAGRPRRRGLKALSGSRKTPLSPLTMARKSPCSTTAPRKRSVISPPRLSARESKLWCRTGSARFTIATWKTSAAHPMPCAP